MTKRVDIDYLVVKNVRILQLYIATRGVPAGTTITTVDIWREGPLTLGRAKFK